MNTWLRDEDVEAIIEVVFCLSPESIDGERKLLRALIPLVDSIVRDATLEERSAHAARMKKASVN